MQMTNPGKEIREATPFRMMASHNVTPSGSLTSTQKTCMTKAWTHWREKLKTLEYGKMSHARVSRVYIVWMILLPIAICRYSAIPIKILRQIFTGLARTIFSFMWNHKKPKTAKTVLNNERSAAGFTAPDFRMCYRGRHCHKSRPIDQQNLIEDPDVHPHIYGHTIFDKEVWNTHSEKDIIFNKWC